MLSDSVSNEQVSALKVSDVPYDEDKYYPGPDSSSWYQPPNYSGLDSGDWYGPGLKHDCPPANGWNAGNVANYPTSPSSSWPSCVTSVSRTGPDASGTTVTNMVYNFIEARTEKHYKYRYWLIDVSTPVQSLYRPKSHEYLYNVVNHKILQIGGETDCSAGEIEVDVDAFPIYCTKGNSTYWLNGTAKLQQRTIEIKTTNYIRTKSCTVTVNTNSSGSSTTGGSCGSTTASDVGWDEEKDDDGLPGTKVDKGDVKYKGGAGCQIPANRTGTHGWVGKNEYKLHKADYTPGEYDPSVIPPELSLRAKDEKVYLHIGRKKLLETPNDNEKEFQKFYGTIYIPISGIPDPPDPYASVASDVQDSDGILPYYESSVIDRFVINNGDGAGNDNKFGVGGNPDKIDLWAATVGPFDTYVSDERSSTVTYSPDYDYLFAIGRSASPPTDAFKQFLGPVQCFASASVGISDECDAQSYSANDVYYKASGQTKTNLSFNNSGSLTNTTLNGDGKTIDVGVSIRNNLVGKNYVMPGYYYILSWLTEDEEVDEFVETNSSNSHNPSLFNPNSPQDEKFTVKWQPFVTSDVYGGDHNNGKYVVPGQTIVDTLTPRAAGSLEDANNAISAEGDNLWAEKVVAGKIYNRAVVACANLYGPYDSPQARINQTINGGGSSVLSSPILANRYGNTVSVGQRCETFGGNEARSIDSINKASKPAAKTVSWDTSGFAPGYYYVVTTVQKAGQDGSDLIFADWTSEFNPGPPEDEWGVTQFQPYATSDVQGGDENNGKYVVSGQTIRDKLTYKATDSIVNANINNAPNNSYWLKDSYGSYIPINFCVTAYGPYQQPQARIKNLPESGGPPIDSSGSLQGGIPGSYAMTNKKQTICQTANGPGSANYDFSTTNWEPGYYYFLTTVNKDSNQYNGYFGSPAVGESNNRGQVSGLSPNTFINDLMIGGWISEFNPSLAGGSEWENEWAVVQFQPYATSTVPNGDGKDLTYVHTGDTIYDKLDIKTADFIEDANNDKEAPESHWLRDGNKNLIPINFCVTAYGPYQQPQSKIENEPRAASYGNDTSGSLASSIPNGYDSNGPKKMTSCKSTGTGGPVADITYEFDTNGWTPGYYYFLTTVNKGNDEYNGYFGPSLSPLSPNNQGAVAGLSPATRIDNLMIGGWISKFNPNDTNEGNGSDEDEWGMVQFQPFATSETPVIWIGDGMATITDKLTSHAAKDYDEAEDGYQAADDLVAYWPKDRNGKYEVATICVVPFGPYQNAQANGTTNGTFQDVIPKDGDGGTITVGQTEEALCLTFTGPEEPKDFAFDTFEWTPGYYYFMSYFRKGATQPTDPYRVVTNDNRAVFYGDWVSKFNPGAEKEATADKFQIKASSRTSSANSFGAPMTVNTGIPSDTASNSWAGHPLDQPDGIVDSSDSGSAVTVLKPTDAYIEDSIYIRAYDTNDTRDVADDEKYWLKDRNNKFISYFVCANVYGPYQQPQGADNGSGSAARSPTAQYIGQTMQPTIKDNYYGNKNSRQQCFWTDKLQDQTGGGATLSLNTDVKDGLVAKPAASGGPGEYKVRWSNTGQDAQGKDNYFQPGYYYIVWNVKKDASSANDNNNGAGCVTVEGNSNTYCTTVDMGSGRVTQENGDFLVSDWYSPFGEQSESFYAQFQPIARSNIPEFEADDSIDDESSRTKSEGNEGIIMECDENKYNNTVNYSDNPEEYPHEKLHCQKVTDDIYLAAVNDKAIATNNSVVATNNDDRYWPKNKDGLWETVKFQVKLYGPFKDADFAKTTTSPAVGLAGGTPISTVPGDVYTAQGVYAQPIAESCVITTSPRLDIGGPNWDGSPGPIKAIFTQDFGSCHGNTPSNTTIELPPGIYTSVVEIVRDDEQTWEVLGRPKPCPYNAYCNEDGDSTQQRHLMNSMLIRDRFTSVWGEPKETLMVPIPLYIVTRRDNSAEDTFIDQVTINDQYWVNGFEAKYVDAEGNRVPWRDIFGNNIPKYGEYDGDEGYFNADIKDQQIFVELYGPYPLQDGRPAENEEYCRTDRLVHRGRWILPAMDTDDKGRDLPYPSPLTLYEKGWYVYQYTFNGGERISNIKTECGDTHEMFRIIKDEIGLVTTAYADKPVAPTRLTDKVTVTGTFTESDANSIVKLSLYKSARGREVRPGITGLDGAPLCTVIFPVSKAGTYDTARYVNADGYALDKEEGVVVSGRCFAETGGHYYWIEEFLRPGTDPLNPAPSDYIQPPGEGKAPEDLDILPPPTPKVTTDADVAASVNSPFRDLAVVEDIPEGNTKVYKLWFTAFGPFADGTVNCTDNLLYSSEANPILVTENGEYYSDFITASSNGLVYWVEHLTDEEDNIVDEGTCGVERETTYVIAPPSTSVPFEPFEALPLYPDAGYFARQIGKIIAFGIVSVLGAWQLTSQKSWLLRKR
jgi:hypothetical protein